MVQSKISQMKIKQSLKVLIYCAIFLYVLRNQANNFVESRPKTLYDHFGIARNATFEQMKDAKDLYMQVLKDKEDPEF